MTKEVAVVEPSSFKVKVMLQCDISLWNSIKLRISGVYKHPDFHKLIAIFTPNAVYEDKRKHYEDKPDVLVSVRDEKDFSEEETF